MKEQRNPKEIDYSLDFASSTDETEEKEEVPVLEFHSMKELKEYFDSIPDGPCNISVKIVREGEPDAE